MANRKAQSSEEVRQLEEELFELAEAVVKKALEVSRLSHKDLAKKAGVATSTLDRALKREGSASSLRTLWKIIRAAGLDKEALLGQEDPRRFSNRITARVLKRIRQTRPDIDNPEDLIPTISDEVYKEVDAIRKE